MRTGNEYETKIQNGTTCINRNKVNKSAECDLLHDIKNSY